MRKDNRGLTLIELIVTVAIIAIFSGVVMKFITTGSNTYRSTSKTSRVQIDAQKTLDEIQDLIIDVNRGIYYASGTIGAVGQEIPNDIDNSTAESKILIACNEEEIPGDDDNSNYVMDVLQWNASDEKISYKRYKKSAPKSTIASSPSGGAGGEPSVLSETVLPGAARSMAVPLSSDGLSGGGTTMEEETTVNNSLLNIINKISFSESDCISYESFAEGIVGFCADMTRVTSSQTVRFKITVENAGKNVDTLHTVNLRNKVQVVPMGNIFAKNPPQNGAISIICPPTAKPGDNLSLFCHTTGNVDPTLIQWSVTTESPCIINGSAFGATTNLMVNSDAVNGQVITVTATYEGNTVTATITVVAEETVKELMNPQDILVGAGNKVNLKTDVSWLYTDKTEVDFNDATWTIDKTNCGSIVNEVLTINPNAGLDAATGSVVVTLTTKDGATASINVGIARIDWAPVKSIYKVGEEKPFLYTYKVRGEKVSNVIAQVSINFTSQQVPGSTISVDITDYNRGRTFTDEYIGKLQFKISYYDNKFINIQTQGIITVVSSTTVIEEGNLQFLGNKPDANIVCITGSPFTCHLRNLSNDISISVTNDEFVWGKDSVEWSITEKSDPETKIERGSVADAKFVLGENEKEFVLTALYIHKDDGVNITKIITASKRIYVLHKIDIRFTQETDFTPNTIASFRLPCIVYLDLHIGNRVISTNENPDDYIVCWLYGSSAFRGLIKDEAEKIDKDKGSGSIELYKEDPSFNTELTGIVSLIEAPELYNKNSNNLTGSRSFMIMP